jgi:hypothetical protein
MKLLVVTPTLGQSPWLAETVASVAAVPADCRHVLVAPAEKTAALAARFPRLQVVPEPAPSRGMYAAINAGLAAAREWDAFTYLNDDDLLLPRFAALAQKAETTVRRRAPLLLYGRVRLIDAHGRRLGVIPVSPRPALNRALYAQRIEPIFQHGTLVTRTAFEQHGGFDESFRFCGDSEYLARLCVAAVPTIRVAGTVAVFRLRQGQLTKNRAALLAERRRVDEKLGLLAPASVWQRYRARWLFRLANLPAYAERLLRHGWLSFDQVLERAGGDSDGSSPQS